MDWSDSAVRFGPSRLDVSLKEFCDAPLKQIRERALEILERLRASRVTLEYLRKVSSADVVTGKPGRSASPSSVMTPLDEKATNKVKGYLRRRVEKLKSADGEEFRSLVPQDRDAFERGFDAFVEACMNAKRSRSTWFEEHLSSGAAQPQLWKIYVAFQRQLRDVCAAQSRQPLPPPLFMKKQEDTAAQVMVAAPPSQTTWHGHSVPQRPMALHYGSYAHPAAAPQSHGRTQSCAEFGRFPPPFSHAFHSCPLNVPCVVLPSPPPPYHIRHSSIPGYQVAAAPGDVLTNCSDQWSVAAPAGMGIQENKECYWYEDAQPLPPTQTAYSSTTSAPTPLMHPRMYNGASPHAIVYTSHG